MSDVIITTGKPFGGSKALPFMAKIHDITEHPPKGIVSYFLEKVMFIWTHKSFIWLISYSNACHCQWMYILWVLDKKERERVIGQNWLWVKKNHFPLLLKKQHPPSISTCQHHWYDWLIKVDLDKLDIIPRKTGLCRYLQGCLVCRHEEHKWRLSVWSLFEKNRTCL